MNQTLISFPLGMLKSPAVTEGRIGMDLKQITVYQEWFPNAFVFMLPELGELSTSREIITTCSSVYISIVKVNIFKVYFHSISDTIGSAQERFGYVWKTHLLMSSK